ncbi:MAG: zf-TFIIB domain-containing protein [Dehalococcoidia bacterium]|nr:zf-TFIIB domain-containing protein [Dehalococcoidia bacterium]
MIVVEYDDVELDYCTKCEGLWFDSGEIDLVAAKSGVQAEACFVLRPATTSEARLRCPICRKKMDKRLLGVTEPVLADVCPSCDGLWLDKGELEQVLAQTPDDAEDTVKERLAKNYLRGTFGKATPDTQSNAPSDTGNAG